MKLLFKALNDPHRRKMLELLKESNLNAGEIAAHFNISKPSISHHLDILRQARLIKAERKGQFRLYSLNIAEIENLLNWILNLKRSK